MCTERARKFRDWGKSLATAGAVLILRGSRSVSRERGFVAEMASRNEWIFVKLDCAAEQRVADNVLQYCCPNECMPLLLKYEITFHAKCFCRTLYDFTEWRVAQIKNNAKNKYIHLRHKSSPLNKSPRSPSKTPTIRYISRL